MPNATKPIVPNKNFFIRTSSDSVVFDVKQYFAKS